MLLLWAATDLRTLISVTPAKTASQQLLSESPLALDVLLPAWSRAKDPRFLRQTGILELNRQAGVHGATLKSSSLNRSNAREIELIEDGSHGWVTIPLLFYPGWTAKTENGSKLNVQAVPENGLLEVEVPDGPHRIELNLPTGPAEKLGAGITAISAVLTLLLLTIDLWERSKKLEPSPTRRA